MIALASLLASGEAGAQSLSDLHLGTWGGSVDAGFAVERQQTHSSDGSPQTDTEFNRIGARATIRNEGFYFVDPEVVTGNLGLTFGLAQDRANTNGAVTSNSTNLNGYAFDSTFFAASPYNGTLYANRNQNLQTQPFGHYNFDFQNFGGILRLREDSALRDWGFPFFSANLRAEQQQTQQTTSVPGQTFSQDELRKILSLDCHKGFETADLNATYELNDVNNSINGAESFQSQTANVYYSLDFGPSLNRRSDTRVFYYTRTGAAPLNLFTADETVRIDHQQNLSTSYRYLLTHSDTLSGATNAQTGVFDLEYKPYRDLSTTTQLWGVHESVPTGLRNSAAGQLALLYRHSLQGGGTVFGRLSGRYQLNDNQLNSSQINVTDEPHVAPTPLGAGAGFLLDHSFVVTSSIVVVDRRGGSRLATTPGTDYDIFVEGDLTRIVPLPSSAVIQAGDPLAVSYTYEVDPSVTYSTTSSSVSGGVDFQWISFSAGHEESNQTLLSGTESQFLQDLREDTAQIDLRGAWKTLQGQVGAAYVLYDSTFLAYHQERYTERVSFLAKRNLTLALNGDWTLTDYTLPVRQTDSTSALLTLDWYAGGGWTVTAEGGRRVFKDSQQATQTIDEARLKARLVYGKLDISAVLNASDRTQGAFQATDWNLGVVMTRRF
jgi:hypothetical protein